jgi:hypothetical protein
MSIRELLLDRVSAPASVEGVSWLARVMPHASRGSRADLLAAYTSASRDLGRSPLALGVGSAPADEIATLPLAHWTLEDAGRLLLLLARDDASAGAEAFAEDAVSCYEQGDAREQQSWLRAVALLPDPARFLPVVIDACRTNILPLFESVACENPYPARYFPDRNFNQLVLKALFNGVALVRIVGLAARANIELARMATDYADERRAAGRSIPADISLALAAPTEQRTIDEDHRSPRPHDVAHHR